MNTRARAFLTVAFAAIAIASPAQVYKTHHLEILSQMQAMSQGTYSEAEWNQLTDRLNEMLAEAHAAGNWDDYVETQVIHAKALAARGRQDEALRLMNETLAAHRDLPVPAMKKVYVELASLYAREGNEDAVNRVMTEFRKSPHFDGETYGYSGGYGPDDPLVVPRPRAGASGSISMTALRVQQSRAHYATGATFPDFSIRDWNGRNHVLREFRQRVVLLDFWANTHNWRRDLPYRKGIYERYHGRGLDVLGLFISPNEQQGRMLAADHQLPWPCATAARPLMKELGIFGDATNFLLDENGVILARDLYGSELDAAIQAALRR